MLSISRKIPTKWIIASRSSKFTQGPWQVECVITRRCVMSASVQTLLMSLLLFVCDSVSKTFWESTMSHVGTCCWGGGGGGPLTFLRLFKKKSIFAVAVVVLLGGRCWWLHTLVEEVSAPQGSKVRAVTLQWLINGFWTAFLFWITLDIPACSFSSMSVNSTVQPARVNEHAGCIRRMKVPPPTEFFCFCLALMSRRRPESNRRSFVSRGGSSVCSGSFQLGGGRRPARDQIFGNQKKWIFAVKVLIFYCIHVF